MRRVSSRSVGSLSRTVIRDDHRTTNGGAYPASISTPAGHGTSGGCGKAANVTDELIRPFESGADGHDPGGTASAAHTTTIPNILPHACKKEG